MPKDQKQTIPESAIKFDIDELVNSEKELLRK